MIKKYITTNCLRDNRFKTTFLSLILFLRLCFDVDHIFSNWPIVFLLRSNHQILLEAQLVFIRPLFVTLCQAFKHRLKIVHYKIMFFVKITNSEKKMAATFVYLARGGWRSSFCCGPTFGLLGASLFLGSSATVGCCGPLFDLEVFLVSYVSSVIASQAQHFF